MCLTFVRDYFLTRCNFIFSDVGKNIFAKTDITNKSAKIKNNTRTAGIPKKFIPVNPIRPVMTVKARNIKV